MRRQLSHLCGSCVCPVCTSARQSQLQMLPLPMLMSHQRLFCGPLAAQTTTLAVLHGTCSCCIWMLGCVNGCPAVAWNHPLAGLDPTGHHAGLPGAADAAGAATAVGGVLRLGSSAAQQQQQLLLSGAPAGVGVTPRSAATAAVQLQLPLRHAVSRELQVYFDRVMGLILAPPSPTDTTSTITVSPFTPAAGGGSVAGVQPGTAGAAAPGADSKQSPLLAGALASVGADPGLHPLVPYFCKSIADGVVQHLGNLGVLHRFLALTRALLANPDVHLAPYLQQLLPAVVTCVVTKTLGERSCVFGGSLPCTCGGGGWCVLVC